MDELIRTLFVLKSLVANAPIIFDWGHQFIKVLTIIVSPGQTKNLLKILSCWGQNQVINNVNNSIKFKEKLVNSHCGFIFFPYCPTKYSNELIDTLFSIIVSGRLGDSDVGAIPVIVSEEGYLDDSKNQLLVLSLLGDLSEVDISLEDVIPEDEYVQFIKEHQKVIKAMETDENQKLLCTSASFLYPFHMDDTLLKADYEIIDNLIAKDEEYHDISGKDQIFLAALRKWQDKLHNPMLCQLPCVNNEVESQINETLFYTEEYVFMSEDMFKRIVQPILGTIPMNALKHGLVESGVLSVNNCKTATYTVKMHYYRECGQHIGQRMLRFVRDRLAPVGDMDIIEAMQL